MVFGSLNVSLGVLTGPSKQPELLAVLDVTPTGSNGEIAILVAYEGELVGVVIDVDTVKESAKQAVSTLRECVVDVMMITGDNERTARAAEQVGINPGDICAGSSRRTNPMRSSRSRTRAGRR